MRIVYCTTDGHNAFNGINAWLIRFLPRIRARGHDVHAWVFTWSRPEHCATISTLRAAGIPTKAMYPPLRTEASIRAILHQARKSRPDLFVSNHVLPALYAGGWLRAAGIPTISVVHNDDAEYRAKLAISGGGDEFFRSSAIVVISEGLKSLAHGIAPETPIWHIPYGVPAGARTATPPSGVLRLVYHGRLAQTQKRILETAAAFVRVARLFGAVEADFYGDGPERGALASLLARDDAGGRVRLRERLSPGQVMGVLPDYHVAVLMSDYEGLGLSLLEGMTCGLVPVCLRIASGPPDFIRDGENGLMVKDREADFDAKIGRLVKNPGLWRQLSDAARESAGRYSETISEEKWEQLFTQLAAGANPVRTIRRPWSIRLPQSHPDLRDEDFRYPGLVRAVWRLVRFGSRR